MRQVTLVVQVESDDYADDVLADLTLLARTYAQDEDARFGGSAPITDIFVADDLGTVSRP